MAFLFASPPPIVDVDPFSALATRKPLAIHTPSLSQPQSGGLSLQQEKARAANIFSSGSSPIAIPAGAVRSARSTPSGGPPSPQRIATGPAKGLGLVTPQGSLVYSPVTPSSPTSANTNDVAMSDAFGTPSVSRVFGSTSSPMEGSSAKSKTSKLPSKNGSTRPPAAINTSHLASPSAPLTPPLTPPHHPFVPTSLPFSALASPLQLPATSPPPSTPTTVSGRLLANYSLHPSFAQEYTIREELGAGGFGFVVRAERNSDGMSVAVKFIERSKIPSRGWVKSRHWGEAPGLLPMVDGYRIVPLEAFVLRSVRHEGVVAYIDLFEDEKYFYLVSLGVLSRVRCDG